VTPTRLLALLESPAVFRAGLGLYALILALGLKQFLIWDQILELEDTPPGEIFGSLHPHAFRWLLMQPVMVLAKAGLNPHLIFTGECFVLIWATSLLLARAGSRIVGRSESALRIWVFLPLTLVTLTMNGRLIPAFFGLALLLALHLELAAGEVRRLGWLVAGQLVGLLAMSVASGTFAVGAVACAGAWGWLLAVRWREPATRRILLPLAALAGVAVAGLAIALFRKAARFFGDDPLQVLNHGAGALLLGHGRVATLGGVAAIVLVAVVLVAAIRLPAGPNGWQVRLPVAASLVFGLFGWSTLVACLPAVVLLAALLVSGRGSDERAPG
jgi:hypothetical protein